jgi:hypothetical protein
MLDAKKSIKVLLIDWIDSCGNSGWLDSDVCKAELSQCQTVGFLVEETKDAYCVALNRTTTKGHKPYGEIISIPKVAIKKVTLLKTLRVGGWSSRAAS